MLNTILGLGIGLSILTSSTTTYKSVYESNIPEPIDSSASTSLATTTLPTRTVEDMISDYSMRYGVNKSVLDTVIKCESGGHANIVGDHGDSIGLVQINLPAHPEITRTQALDPEFSVEYLAHQLSLGHGKLWTCWRQNYLL